MEKFDFQTYMRECASLLAEIGHSEFKPRFFRISGIGQLDELLQNLSKAQFPALLISETVEGIIHDRNMGDNYLDTPYYVFYIVKQVKLADVQGAEDAKKECKGLGNKILSRMLRDKKKMQKGLTFMHFPSIQYSSVGPMGDNCFGIMFSFTVSDSAELQYHEKDWLDTEE